MHFRQHLPLILLVAWGLVDVGVLIIFSIMEAAGTLTTALWDPVFFGLVLVQGSLVAAWFYLSDLWAAWHVGSLPVMILCLAPCVPQPLWIAGTILVHLLIIAVANYPLGILRDRGWRYRFHPTFPEERKPFQFSLSDLVGVTFLVAVCLGVWLLLGRTVTNAMISTSARFCLSLGLLAWLPGIRVVVGMAQSPLMLAAWGAAATVHVRLMTITLSKDMHGNAFVVMIAACGVVLALQAAALRWAGWRIERDPRRDRRQRPAAELKPLPHDVADAVHSDAGR